MKTKVQIEDNYGVKLSLKRKISKIVELLFNIDEIQKNSAIKDFDVNTLSFGIVFICDPEIRKINKEYRNKDKETDVITFALFADDENKFVFRKTAELGEILISVDTAKKQAKEGLEKEILTLIAHGILHLLGFDHLTNEDYNFVVGVQEKVIAELLWKNTNLKVL